MKEELKTRISHWKSTVSAWVLAVLSISYPYFIGKDLSEITWQQVMFAVVIGIIGSAYKPKDKP